MDEHFLQSTCGVIPQSSLSHVTDTLPLWLSFVQRRFFFVLVFGWGRCHGGSTFGTEASSPWTRTSGESPQGARDQDSSDDHKTQRQTHFFPTHDGVLKIEVNVLALPAPLGVTQHAWTSEKIPWHRKFLHHTFQIITTTEGETSERPPMKIK